MALIAISFTRLSQKSHLHLPPLHTSSPPPAEKKRKKTRSPPLGSTTTLTGSAPSTTFGSGSRLHPRLHRFLRHPPRQSPPPASSLPRWRSLLDPPLTRHLRLRPTALHPYRRPPPPPAPPRLLAPFCLHFARLRPAPLCLSPPPSTTSDPSLRLFLLRHFLSRSGSLSLSLLVRPADSTFRSQLRPLTPRSPPASPPTPPKSWLASPPTRSKPPLPALPMLRPWSDRASSMSFARHHALLLFLHHCPPLLPFAAPQPPPLFSPLGVVDCEIHNLIEREKHRRCCSIKLIISVHKLFLLCLALPSPDAR